MARTSDRKARLVAPAYLDVPMMVTFLATLDGGVRFEDQITVVQRDTSGKEQDVKARVGLPSVLSLLSLSASGRIGTTAGEESSEQVSMVKRHTEASPFNVLLQRLDQSGVIMDLTSDPSLGDLKPGDLVELSGQVIENPLKRLLSLLIRMAPLLGIDLQQLVKKGPPRPGGGKGRPGEVLDADALEGVRSLLLFGADMFDSQVEDLVLDGSADRRVVVTADVEFMTEGALQRVLGCHYNVLGKVTRVLSKDDRPIISLGAVRSACFRIVRLRSSLKALTRQ
jgi:hypothetical protein